MAHAPRNALKNADDNTIHCCPPRIGVSCRTWGKITPFQGLPHPLPPRDGTDPGELRIVPIILSGGAGTRLWPLSRETAPKPSMPLPDGETLLAKTAARALALPGVAELVTVTNRDYYFHTKDVYAGLRGTGPARWSFLLEPFGRNTAPAIALAALCVATRPTVTTRCCWCCRPIT